MLLDLEAAMEKKGIKPWIRDRIRRLNPNGVHEGELIRGYHPTQTWHVFVFDLMGKGVFIKKYGHKAWNKMPKRKFGRREFTTRAAVEDCLWMAP